MDPVGTSGSFTFADGIAARARPANGHKVLWVHGYTLDATSWTEMWDLLPGWHHIGIDLPGHGASRPIEEHTDLHHIAQRVGHACEAAGIRLLVGLSFGTLTATQLAIEFPHQFDAVVLAAPSLAGGPVPQEAAADYTDLHAIYRRHGVGDEVLDAWMASPPWQGLDEVPGLGERMRPIVARHPWDELRTAGLLYRAFHRPPQGPVELRRIGAHTLVVLGEREMPAFRRCADTLAAEVPRCHRFELPGVHHLCLLEAPVASARAIERHFAVAAGAAGGRKMPQQPPGKSA